MDYNFKKKQTCGQWKLIHYIIPIHYINYEMTVWYKNIYLGLGILCISKVSSKKILKHSQDTKKDTERILINLRTMKKTLSSIAIPKKHSKTKTAILSQIKESQI